MIGSEGGAPDVETARGQPSVVDAPSSHPLTTLRGAGVDVDVRLVATVAIGLVFVTLVVLAVALSVAGASKNSHIASLRADGVPVRITVTSCDGLMGGSGSNLAGYACSGFFESGGRRYELAIPGSGFYAVGSTIAAVALRNDPSIASTVGALRGERPSWKVFIAPAAIVAVLLAGLGGLLALRRSRARAGASAVAR